MLLLLIFLLLLLLLLLMLINVNFNILMPVINLPFLLLLLLTISVDRTTLRHITDATSSSMLIRDTSIQTIDAVIGCSNSNAITTSTTIPLGIARRRRKRKLLLLLLVVVWLRWREMRIHILKGNSIFTKRVKVIRTKSNSMVFRLLLYSVRIRITGRSSSSSLLGGCLIGRLGFGFGFRFCLILH